jgi:hypothetical protein
MKILLLHTNPFDLGAHLEDEHEMTPWVIDQMDSDALRRTHEVIHARSEGFLDHIHTHDPEWDGVEVVID